MKKPMKEIIKIISINSIVDMLLRPPMLSYQLYCEFINLACLGATKQILLLENVTELIVYGYSWIKRTTGKLSTG